MSPQDKKAPKDEPEKKPRPPKPDGPKPKLITHRDLAKLVGVTPQTIRKWVGRGSWPRPHSIVERTWFYRKEDVDTFIATGWWPDGMRYLPGMHTRMAGMNYVGGGGRTP